MKAKKTALETQFVAGTASDSVPQLADLVWQTDPELFQYFYYGDHGLLGKLFAAEWPSPIGFIGIFYSVGDRCVLWVKLVGSSMSVSGPLAGYQQSDCGNGQTDAKGQIRKLW